MAAVEQGARDEWIGLFSSGATLEDPVDGSSVRAGTTAIAEFWDTGIAMFESVRFDIQRVHEAPGEALVLADVSVTAPGGAAARYDAAVHYRIDDNGGIASLRAFWDLPAMLAQLAGD
jgi:steroid Delta-isomerase